MTFMFPPFVTLEIEHPLGAIVTAVTIKLLDTIVLPQSWLQFKIISCRGADGDGFMIRYMLLKLVLVHKFSITSFTFIFRTRSVCSHVLSQQCLGFSFKITFVTNVELSWRNCVDGF